MKLYDPNYSADSSLPTSSTSSPTPSPFVTIELPEKSATAPVKPVSSLSSLSSSSSSPSLKPQSSLSSSSTTVSTATTTSSSASSKSKPVITVGEVLALHNKMVQKIQQKKYDEAQVLAHQLLDIDSTGSNGLVYYNLACVESVNGHVANSLTYLQLALQNGYKNFASIYKDSDLVQVREDAGYAGFFLFLCFFVFFSFR